MTAPLPALRRIASQSRLSTNTSIGLVDGEWRQTQFVTNPIEFAQTLFPRGVKLSRAGGPISQLLDGLGAGAILRLDVVKDAQMVLYLPRPLQAPPRLRRGAIPLLAEAGHDVCQNQGRRRYLFQGWGPDTDRIGDS